MIFLEGESRMSAKLTNKETTQQQYVPWRAHTQDKEASRPDRLGWIGQHTLAGKNAPNRVQH